MASDTPLWPLYLQAVHQNDVGLLEQFHENYLEKRDLLEEMGYLSHELTELHRDIRRGNTYQKHDLEDHWNQEDISKLEQLTWEFGASHRLLQATKKSLIRNGKLHTKHLSYAPEADPTAQHAIMGAVAAATGTMAAFTDNMYAALTIGGIGLVGIAGIAESTYEHSTDAPIQLKKQLYSQYHRLREAHQPMEHHNQ